VRALRPGHAPRPELREKYPREEPPPAVGGSRERDCSLI
jgi:hypothetical protein